jgi:hypothetical protein
MLTKEIHNFGNIYTLSGDEIEKFETLKDLFEVEENYILNLKNQYNLEVREDLLILFVQMYLLRFAIPYFQLTHNQFPDDSNVNFLKKVLYFCLIGRFIDDLVDSDSKLFKTYESILLFQKYYPRLTALLSLEDKAKFDLYLFESTKYKSLLIVNEINFNDIRNDVYSRIKYFFCEAENYNHKTQEYLKTYTGILLGGLDLNDLISDGYLQNSSTIISNNVYHKYYNDEGKLLLNKALLNYYGSLELIFDQETKQLIEHCRQNTLLYTTNILKKIQR